MQRTTEVIICRLCKQSFGKTSIGGFFLKGRYICKRCEKKILMTNPASPVYEGLIKQIRLMLA